MPRHVRRTANLRRRLYEILEHGSIGDRTGLMVDRLIVLLIVINLVSMTLDSVPELQTQYGALFTIIELLSLVVFTIEYALRVWVAAEHAPARHSSERKARWKFVLSPSVRSTSSPSCRFGLHLCCRSICGSCSCFGWAAFSSWRATRPPCVRCWTLFTTSAARY